MVALKTCSICRRPYRGSGRSAQPINSGRCCDNCNITVVIPERLREIVNAEERATKKEG